MTRPSDRAWIGCDISRWSRSIMVDENKNPVRKTSIGVCVTKWESMSHEDAEYLLFYTISLLPNPMWTWAWHNGAKCMASELIVIRRVPLLSLLWVTKNITCGWALWKRLRRTQCKCKHNTMEHLRWTPYEARKKEEKCYFLYGKQNLNHYGDPNTTLFKRQEDVTSLVIWMTNAFHSRP